MHCLTTRRRVRAIVGAAALAMALPAGSVVAAHHPARHSSTPKWLVANAKSKTATLTLIAAYNNNLGGFNFDGYGYGKMVVSIPLHYKVTVIFSNKSSTPHNVLVVPYSERNKSSGLTLAFKGAGTGSATTGISKGTTKKFSFVASKTGTYALLCGVPGHDLAGMWDTLQVTNGGSAKISFK